MKLYKIANWAKSFENNRTKELKTLNWVPIPNKQDGDGYTLVMDSENGPAIYGAWIACVQIASRCDPRGTLLRDSGKPHDAYSLARMSRFPQEVIQQMLDLLSSPDINWLDVTICEQPATQCGNPASPCGKIASPCLEGNGREGNGKHTNGGLPKTDPWEPTESMKRFNRLFQRRDTTVWSAKEIKALRAIEPISDDDMRELEYYYTMSMPKEKDYRRRDLLTLLNNFNGEVDRAKNLKAPSLF